MLADNRDLIADILEGLASHYCAAGDCRREMIVERGADTLRWSMALDATPTGEELAELERLREVFEAVEDVLTRLKVEGKREHPASKLNAIRTAVGMVRV